jgi:ubiquinol-cytochrome c reductase cytochrome b/c1 subunit
MLGAIKSILVIYKTPTTLTGMWSFGFMSFIFLVGQIITGLILLTQYIPDVNLAAKTIEVIMRDVPTGWLFRFVHMSGASFFFMAIYIHIARGLTVQSFAYPRVGVWLSGFAIFVVSMAIAFCGYILPWGQMSYWGATVITNLLTILPKGEQIVTWGMGKSKYW